VVGEIFAGICGLSSAFTCREYALGYAIEIETDLQNPIRRRHPAARLYGDVKLVSGHRDLAAPVPIQRTD
jgi:site-specific DNA-cytosine methylase